MLENSKQRRGKNRSLLINIDGVTAQSPKEVKFDVKSTYNFKDNDIICNWKQDNQWSLMNGNLIVVNKSANIGVRGCH